MCTMRGAQFISHDDVAADSVSWDIGDILNKMRSKYMDFVRSLRFSN